MIAGGYSTQADRRATVSPRALPKYGLDQFDEADKLFAGVGWYGSNPSLARSSLARLTSIALSF